MLLSEAAHHAYLTPPERLLGRGSRQPSSRLFTPRPRHPKSEHRFKTDASGNPTPLITKMSTHGTILLDAEDLRAKGLLHDSPVPGFQRLHRRRVCQLSDEIYNQYPLDYLPDAPHADEVYVTIPEVLISRDTLTYVGLSDARATELWQQWCARPVEGPSLVVGEPNHGIDEVLANSFLKFILSQTKREPDVYDEDDDAPWRAYYNSCGINQKTQNVIMEPKFADVRLSESCWYWLKDTMEMRFEALQLMQYTSLDRVTALRQTASASTSASSSNPGAQEGDPSAQIIGSGQTTSAGGCEAAPTDTPTQGDKDGDRGTSSPSSQDEDKY